MVYYVILVVARSSVVFRCAITEVQSQLIYLS